jgi:adenylylsulfate kinase
LKNIRQVVWHQSSVARSDREALNGHRGAIVWLTGLSASGKSTIAHGLEETLHRNGYRTFVLDGDNVRHGLCGDLGFSIEDRDENLRRIGEVAKLFLDAGTIVISAFISPLCSERARIRQLMPPGDFLEIHCSASLSVCEARDPKGLYAKARSGELREFTGISSPYEPPTNPELVLETGKQSIDRCLGQVLDLMHARGILAWGVANGPATS